MNIQTTDVCPVEIAGTLDNRIRRWFQNPKKILGPFVKEGMVALDIGCGPGFFSIDLAQMVGKTGKVIAADLQEGMLDKLQRKIEGTELAERISLHQCEKDKIGVTEKVDFVLLFYMVHEIPDVVPFFREIATILKPNGQVFLVEPPFHVSKKAFEATLAKATSAGLTVVSQPKMFLDKAVVLRKALD